MINFLGGPLTLRGFSNRGAGPHKESDTISLTIILNAYDKTICV